jgi:putative addiction module component (TIGR02574 family)
VRDCISIPQSAINKWAGEEKMNHNDSVQSLFDLSPPEKLQLVEDLWDDLAAAPSEVPVHEWQKKELALRKANLMREPSSGLLWDKLK